MALSQATANLPSLRKYTRTRQLLARNGYYLEIYANGEIGCTRNEASPNSILEILSVGPDLIAIGGAEAKKYLAVDSQGNLFTSTSERKECVFKEFLGQNFHSLIRTCHMDANGRGWYLSINNRGRVGTKKTSYSDHPQLHFIIKVVKEKKEPEKDVDETSKRASTPIWRRKSMEELDEFIDFNSFTPSPASGMSIRSSISGGESSGGSVENYTSC